MERINLRAFPSQPISSKPQVATNHENPKEIDRFSDHLLGAMGGKKLTISRHANLRMAQRGIDIGVKQWDIIELKVNEARSKGVKESLVLLNNAALIVSAKNQTVITVMNREEASSQIFTNIDGTIILD
jgi:flagellar operon protein